MSSLSLEGPWEGGPLVVRRANPSDRDGILGIDSSGGAYDEADYLPAKLLTYLRDPNRICYVGEVDGKMVTFFTGRNVSEGTVIIGRLARVEKAYRNTGAWNKTRYLTISDYMFNRYPSVRTYLGCFSDYKTFHHPRDPTMRFNIIMVRAKVMVQVPSTCLLNAPRDDNLCLRSEEMSIAACHDLLSDRARCFRLFPHRVAMVGREPVPITLANLPLITEECVSVYGTHDTGSSFGPPDCTTLSFGTLYDAPQGHFYEMDVYTSTDSVAELAHHICHHVSVGRRRYADATIKLIMFLHPFIKYELLRRATAQLNDGLVIGEMVEYATCCLDMKRYHDYLKAKL